MLSKLKSGAQKRKEKKELDACSSKLPKLDGLFLKPPALDLVTSITSVNNVEESDLEPTGQPEISLTLHPKETECKVTSSGATAAGVRSTNKGLYGAQEVPDTTVELCCSHGLMQALRTIPERRKAREQVFF